MIKTTTLEGQFADSIMGDLSQTCEGNFKEIKRLWNKIKKIIDKEIEKFPNEK